MDEKELQKLIQSGFAAVSDKLSNRDRETGEIARTLQKLETGFEGMKDSLAMLQKDFKDGELLSIKVKIPFIETGIAELKARIESNDNWIRGLLVSVVLLLAGMLYQLATKGK